MNYLRFVITLLLLCSVDLSAFEYSGNVKTEYNYLFADDDSLLNRNNITGTSKNDCVLGFGFRGKDSIANSKLSYVFKLRGEKNYYNNYDISVSDGDGGKTVNEGRSYFIADELYANYAVTSEIGLFFGKERIAWGNGLVWNPVDVINPGKRTDTSKYDEEGTLIAAVQAEFGVFDFTFYYNPELINYEDKFDYQYSNIAFRFSHDSFGFYHDIYYYQRLDENEKIAFPNIGYGVNYLVDAIETSFIRISCIKKKVSIQNFIKMKVIIMRHTVKRGIFFRES